MNPTRPKTARKPLSARRGCSRLRGTGYHSSSTRSTIKVSVYTPPLDISWRKRTVGFIRSCKKVNNRTCIDGLSGTIASLKKSDYTTDDETFMEHQFRPWFLGSQNKEKILENVSRLQICYNNLHGENAHVNITFQQVTELFKNIMGKNIPKKTDTSTTGYVKRNVPVRLPPIKN